MTELDFDELDKAVSDLMKDADTHDDTPAAVAPAEPADEPNNETSGEPVAVAAVPAPALKRRGQFMDVKPSAGIAPPVAKPAMANHEGTSIEPPAATDPEGKQITVTTKPKEEQVAPDTPDSTLVDSEPEPTPEPGGEYAANPAAVNEWPDPIDMAEQHEQPERSEEVPEPEPEQPEPVKEDGIEPSPVSHDELATVIEPEVAPEPSTDTQPDKAMESPFIPDAKVEKRPLGGFAGDTPQEGAAPEAAPLPRELGSDLMNLEADTNATKSAQAEPEKPEISAANDKKDAAAPVAVTAPAAGTIYDTDSYHKPIGAPAKKRSGWMILIWILVLMIIGACAGAAYFYFTTQ